MINGKVAVTVERVLVEERRLPLSYSAALEPSAKTSFVFPVEMKIARLGVRLGERVSAGALLFELDEADLSLKAAGLKAKRQEKKAALDKNTYFFQERDRLLTEGKIDQTQYDSLEMELNASRAEYDKISAEIGQIENQIANAIVRAPFDGIVADLRTASGVTAPAGEPLLTLTRIDPLHVSFAVPAEEIAGIRAGAALDIRLEGFEAQTYSATVILAGPEIDPATRRFTVKAELPNPAYALRAGLNAQVRLLSTTAKKILSIPRQALRQEGTKEYVYVVREGKAWPVRIFTRPDSDNSDLLVIQEGLTEGELVVTQGHEKLKAGVEVNLWR